MTLLYWFGGNLFICVLHYRIHKGAMSTHIGMFDSTTVVSPIISPIPNFTSNVKNEIPPLYVNKEFNTYDYTRVNPFDESIYQQHEFQSVEKSGESSECNETNLQPNKEENTKKVVIDKDLLIYKAFYFMFYGAVGSLFPYLVVFYKQLYLSAQQVGFLIGIRPFIQMVSVPLWGALADTYNVKKLILLLAIGAWLGANYSLCIVRVPPENACNSSLSFIQFPKVGKLVEPNNKLNVNLTTDSENTQGIIDRNKYQERRKKSFMVDKPTQDIEIGLTMADDQSNQKLLLVRNNTERMQYHTETKKQKIRKKSESYGEIANKSSIAIRFLRTTKFGNLYRLSRRYDRSPHNGRLWSWLNKSTYDTGTTLQRILAADELEEEFDSLNIDDDYPWPLDTIEAKNFEDLKENRKQASDIFKVLIIITVVGTVLASPAATLADAATLEKLGDKSYQYGYQRLWGAFGWGLCAFVVGTIVSSVQLEECKEGRHVDYILSFYVYAGLMGMAFICAVFFKFNPVANTTDYTQSLWDAVKIFTDVQHVLFVLTLLISGASMGFVHTFLFWHLHDLGGTQFLFSVITAVQCVSEVIVYLFSGLLLIKIGCENVLYIGLLFNTLRLFAYSLLTQPILAMLLEILHGVSSACIWTASICYINQIPGAPVTLQAFLHGIYWGLGHGGGGILGGVLVSYLGSNRTFITYGVVCLINLILLVGIKYKSKILQILCNYAYVENIPTGTYILTGMSRINEEHCRKSNLDIEGETS